MSQVHNGVKYATGIVQSASTIAGLGFDAAGIERLGETLTPILDVWSQPEFAILRGEYLWSFFAAQAAVAAECSIIAVVNPTNSGLVAIVDRVGGTGPLGQDVAFGVCSEAQAIATLTSAGKTPLRDNRRSGNAFLDAYSGSDPAFFVNILERIVPPTNVEVREFLTPPWVFKPGTGIFVEGVVVNQSLRGTFRGRVRTALPGELVV